MYEFFKNRFNGFVNYLTNNSSETFNKIKKNSGQFKCSNNIVNFDDIKKRIKSKIELEDKTVVRHKLQQDDDQIQEVVKERRGASISYVVLIKRQRLIRSLKKVTKSLGGLFPEKSKKQQKKIRAMIDYKLSLICTKAMVLKDIDRKFGKINISKSILYLDEGMDAFLTRVKYGINNRNNQRGL